jgi:hypothetical protein
VVECPTFYSRNYIARTCDPCGHLYWAEDQSCHTACPPFTYQSSSHECAGCLPPCRLCSGAAACLDCEQGLLLLGGQCTRLCPSAHFASARECRVCPPNCEGCNLDGCLACATSYFLEFGVCNDSCSQCVIRVVARGF